MPFTKTRQITTFLQQTRRVRRLKGARWFPVLVLSGESGSGKTMLVLRMGLEFFDGVTSDTLAMTFYTTATPSGLPNIGPSVAKDERDDASRRYMEALVRLAMDDLRREHPQATHLFLALDECGESTETIRGIIATVAQWSQCSALEGRTLMVALCSTGIDHVAVEMGRPVGSDRHNFEHVHLEPWTRRDSEAYFGPELWPSISCCTGLVAMAANPRCAWLMREILERPGISPGPSELIHETAGAYRKLNALVHFSNTELQDIVRVSLAAVVLEADLVAAAKAVGVDFQPPTAESFRRANVRGILTYSGEPQPAGTLRVAENGYYTMTCALLLMCLGEFGLLAPVVRAFDDFESLVAVYYGAVSTALGLEHKLAHMRNPAPPRTALKHVMASWSKVPGSEPTVESEFPKDLVAIKKDAQLEARYRCVVLVNGPQAPAWDVAVGWLNKRTSLTLWWVIQAKFTTQKPRTVKVDWADELPKLGVSNLPSATPREDVAKAKAQEELDGAKAQEEPDKAKAKAQKVLDKAQEVLAAWRAHWVNRTMNVRRRILATNGETKPPKGEVPDLAIVQLPGPFAVLSDEMRLGDMSYEEHEITMPRPPDP